MSPLNQNLGYAIVGPHQNFYPRYAYAGQTVCKTTKILNQKIMHTTILMKKKHISEHEKLGKY